MDLHEASQYYNRALLKSFEVFANPNVAGLMYLLRHRPDEGIREDIATECLAKRRGVGVEDVGKTIKQMETVNFVKSSDDHIVMTDFGHKFMDIVDRVVGNLNIISQMDTDH